MDNTQMCSILLLVHVPIWLNDMSKCKAIDVCTETVTRVSKCPRNTREYSERVSERMCFKACRHSEGDYKYHCMQDSTTGELKEMCAIPKYLFSFCPAYDPVGQQIQKDESRPCFTSSSATYYISSNLFFCNLTICLDSPTNTTSDSPIETIDMTETQNDGKSWYYFLISIITITAVLTSLSIFLVWKKRQNNEYSICFQILTPGCCWKSPRKEPMENKQNEEQAKNMLMHYDGHNVIVV